MTTKNIHYMKVLVHEPKHKTTAWANKGITGFYLGPAMNHHKCHNVWIPTTASTRVTDTMAKFPDKIHLPGSSHADILKRNLKENLTKANNHDLIKAISDLISIIDKDPIRAENILAATPKPTEAQRVNDTTETQRVKTTNSHTRTNNKWNFTTYDKSIIKRDLRQAATNQIGRTFIDVDENKTYQITDIVANTNERKRPPTPYFAYYDINAHPDGKPEPDYMEYQPISEFLYKKKGTPRYTHRPSTKDQNYRFINSIFHSKIGQKLLNIDPTTRSSLTYSKAMTGPNQEKWLTASDEEVQRLMTSGTIRPIFTADQPSHRKKDTTYYAPKPKEKLDQHGNIIYRMRGTLGGDKVNYDGETLSTVADPVTINIHQQSVLADRKQGLDARYVTADCSDYYLGCKLE